MPEQAADAVAGLGRFAGLVELLDTGDDGLRVCLVD
jgi:hypothetical protein